MSEETETQNGDIDVGKELSELRLWRAKEECRQAELRLAAQLSSVQSMESRVNSLLTWSVGAVLALNAAHARLLLPGQLACLSLGACAALCVAAAWPSKWHYGAYLPSELRAFAGETELEVLECVAIGLESACVANQKRIKALGYFLRFAWILFVCAAALEVLGVFTSAS